MLNCGRSFDLISFAGHRKPEGRTNVNDSASVQRSFKTIFGVLAFASRTRNQFEGHIHNQFTAKFVKIAITTVKCVLKTYWPDFLTTS